MSLALISLILIKKPRKKNNKKYNLYKDMKNNKD